MMEIIADPPRGVGPIKIGMPFDQAVQVLRSIDGYIVPPLEDKVPPGFAHYESELSISIEPDRTGRVKSVEIYRPEGDVKIFWGGISIFDTPAEDVIRKVSEKTRITIEDDGLSVVAYELLISLWRSVLPEDSSGQEGRYFESILVAAPGYYGDVLSASPVSS